MANQKKLANRPGGGRRFFGGITRFFGGILRNVWKIFTVFLIIFAIIFLTSGKINQREAVQNTADYFVRIGKEIGDFIITQLEGNGIFKINENGVYQKDAEVTNDAPNTQNLEVPDINGDGQTH